MDLLAKLRGRGDDLNDVPTAVMTPIVAAMLADGRVDENEVLHVEAICATSPVFERNSGLQNERLILHVTRMIEDKGAEAMCRKAAQVLSPPLRETAFMYAVRVVFSDGYIGETEQGIIENLTGWLSISEERATAMIDVATIMQNGVDA
ncbi:tellurite resistance TerB family protein [Caulobacter sp. NIBR1757]|uniref:tellurite resistance TerB family protein n=1 Tax=Caulobacter sp. NIBR1757 TaxID=3016000 RepID=UPI0022F063AC|nr:tellurite resistance TerB family protein [Caulobacter sp. NIBR1757]WGM39524.1 hypothetical protein AMEJIAPC_02448 [Caulobacter sp. NIBR1757]